MFKSATFFCIAQDFVLPPLASLEEAFQSGQFLPCGATQAESIGWVPPRGNKSTVLVEAVGQGAIVRLCVERRAVPASAIKDEVDVQVEKYKQETGRERVSSKLKKEFKEEAVLTLLPRAFTKRFSTTMWIDPVNKFLVVDTASLSGADKIVSYLIESLSEIPGSRPGVMAKPVQTTMSAGAAMAHWLGSREAPFNFTVDRDCELKVPDEQKSAVRYSSHTLEIEEVVQHIAAGKVPTLLAMTWNDRVSFQLSDSGQVRKIKLLDVVLDGAQENGKDDNGFDTDAAIITGELAALYPDLLEALGGQLSMEQAEAAPQATPTIASAAAAPLGDEPDPLYADALDLVKLHQKPSISLVQRHLKLGYNRAARLIERMEAEGKVSPMDAGGARTMLAA